MACTIDATADVRCADLWGLSSGADVNDDVADADGDDDADACDDDSYGNAGAAGDDGD